jgi:hypothetical protein
LAQIECKKTAHRASKQHFFSWVGKVLGSIIYCGFEPKTGLLDRVLGCDTKREHADRGGFGPRATALGVAQILLICCLIFMAQL